MGVAAHRLIGVAGAAAWLTCAWPAGALRIDVGSAAGSPGHTVALAVRLRAEGSVVVATENDLVFDPHVPVTACRANPAIGKELTSFGFLPPGCVPGEDCKRLRAIVLGNDLEPIPDGSVLYTCTVRISAALVPDAVLPIDCEDAGASDPQAQQLEATCSPGAVHVLRAPMCVGDGDGDRRVTIAELIEAVRNALEGCPEPEAP